MKVTKSKLMKLFCTIVVLMAVVVSPFTFQNNNTFAFAAIEQGLEQEKTHKIGQEQLISTEKIYSHVTIADDFDGSSVMVIVDRNFSGINKRHSVDFFGDIKISGIDDLTAIPDNLLLLSKDNLEDNLSVSTTEARSRIDEKNFEQVMQIFLPQDCKETVINTIKHLERIEGIKYAGPNRYLELEQVPNDPLFTHPTVEVNGQWGKNKIQASQAWYVTTGSRNVRVGVIDTGIDWHDDFGVSNSGNPWNLGKGMNFVNTNSDWNDTRGHGTHVAGIIGAVGNNGLGVTGVNWDVTLVPMKVANTSGGIVDAACVSAVTFARNSMSTSNPISVLNFSIGRYSAWPEMETVIRQYSDAGGLFVCSTGNAENNNDTTRHYPSFYASALHTDPIAGMIAVGRSNINDQRPTGANWGANTISLYAPGQHILSTYSTERCGKGTSVCQNDGTIHHSYGYHYASGSSMSAPMVAGVAALILSEYPEIPTSWIKDLIISSADKTPALASLCVSGGRLNAYNALKTLIEPIATVSGNFTGNQGDLDSIASFYSTGSGVELRIKTSTGSSFTTETIWWSSSNYDVNRIKGRVVAGNFNGNTDGRDQIAAFFDLGSGRTAIHVWLSTGTSFERHVWWEELTPGLYNANQITDRVVAGRFVNNSRYDIAAFHDYGYTPNPETRIHLFSFNGTGFTMHTWCTLIWYNANMITGRVVAGDFTGNGLYDIAAIHDYGGGNARIHVFLSTGTSFNYQGSNGWLNMNYYWASLLTGRVVAGRFGNSNRYYIAAFCDYGLTPTHETRIHLFLSSGAGFSMQTWCTLTWYNANMITNRVVVGRFWNGNRHDIAAIYDYGDHYRTHVFLSTGSSFSYQGNAGW